MSDLEALVESLRRKHHDYVDEDGFYSCPLAENAFGHEGEGCCCGLNEYNAKIDKILAEVRRILERMVS